MQWNESFLTREQFFFQPSSAANFLIDHGEYRLLGDLRQDEELSFIIVQTKRPRQLPKEYM